MKTAVFTHIFKKITQPALETEGLIFVVAQWPAQAALRQFDIFLTLKFTLRAHGAQVEGKAQTGERFIEMRQRKESCWYFGEKWVLDFVIKPNSVFEKETWAQIPETSTQNYTTQPTSSDGFNSRTKLPGHAGYLCSKKYISHIVNHLARSQVFT